MTPPGSPCSIHFGKGITTAAPGSVKNLYLVVSDIEAARAELIGRGADVSEPFHFTGFGGRAVPGPDPERRLVHDTYATFSDPDGNSWLLQEIKTRLPGRGLSSLDVATLTELLREAETAARRSTRPTRAEAPLVGLVRRLHRRARAGQDSRGSDSRCGTAHRWCRAVKVEHRRA